MTKDKYKYIEGLLRNYKKNKFNKNETFNEKSDKTIISREYYD